jgi:hypothetical protein
MKLYKFRPLASKLDFCRAKSILETNFFWCSKFWDLNGPMEGTFHSSVIDSIDKVFVEKIQYKICSFSGEKAFKNPAVWGYYTNGFRGYAVEIEIPNAKEAAIRKVNYKKDINDADLIKRNKAEIILTTKLIPWEHEDEYRFLIRSGSNSHKIGKITAVYFGEPYGNAINKTLIYNQSFLLSEYEIWRAKLIKVVKNIEIDPFLVEVQKSKVCRSKRIA